MINKDSLKARANNISKELNIPQNVIYNRFFFDAFLSRLAISPYKDKLVLKGGLYLSSILGLDTRVTMDIDFYLKRLSLEREKIIDLIEEIISIDIQDDISFQIVGSENIRLDDLYGGFQVILLARLDNLRYQFSVDIATGDPIVPSEQNYDYKCLVTGETLTLKAYSLESVVAEKLETVLSRGIANSRSKDFYDLYVLNKTQFKNIDKNILKDAWLKTCDYRAFLISKDEALELINEITKNREINKRWISYGKKVKYSENLSFEEVINSIREWIDICL